eukprot:gene25045-32651_t
MKRNRTRLVFIFTSFFAVYAQIVDKNPSSIKKYPQQSLKCYSSLTKPDKQLICPASRANFCVKQVSSLTSDICGGTQYFGDEYVNGQCQYKKCNATCTPGSFSFTFQGQTYSRATLFPLSHWSLYSSSTDTKSIDTLPQLDPVLSNESATIITQQSIDKLTHLSKENLSDNNPLSELSLSFIKELEKVLNRKVDFATLNEFTTDICSWINPFISNIKEAAEEINKFSNFFSDTRIVVFNQRVVSPDTVEIDYQLSFWYPLPWRPRIIIPSVATIKFDRSVTDNKLRISSITEKWEV